MDFKEKRDGCNANRRGEDFYIISDNDDLILTSKEAVELLLDELESVEYDEELANFYSKFYNEIDDRTME